jgi:UDP-N-acetylmuramate--alanine ligase
MDIYGAGEPPIEGVHARVLAEMMARTSKGSVRYESDREALVRRLRSESEPGDVVITLGAGDVYKIGNELVHGN